MYLKLLRQGLGHRKLPAGATRSLACSPCMSLFQDAGIRSLPEAGMLSWGSRWFAKHICLRTHPGGWVFRDTDPPACVSWTWCRGQGVILISLPSWGLRLGSDAAALPLGQMWHPDVELGSCSPSCGSRGTAGVCWR